MAGVKISALPFASALNGTEISEVVQSGLNVQVTESQRVAFMAAAVTLQSLLSNDNTTGPTNTITFQAATPNTVAVFNGSNELVSGGATLTEVGYLSGVTSAIQTQLNLKAPLASPTLSGVPTAPTAVTGTHTAQIATCDFVNNSLGAFTGSTNIVTVGSIGTGTWQGTSISTTYTDAKIKGSVAATSGRIVLGNGAADTITTNSSLGFNTTNTCVYVGTDGSGTNDGYHTQKSVNSLLRVNVVNGTSNTAAAAGYTAATTTANFNILLTSSSYSASGLIKTNQAIFSANSNSGGMLFNSASTSSGASMDFATAATLRLSISKDGAFTYWDGANFRFGTSTGSILGNAGDKFGFWGATPVVQQTTGVASATYVSTIGTIVNDTDTYDGYTIKQVVKALRIIGILA